MASIIYSNSGKVGYNLKEYLVDTTADMADLPYDLPLGTKAFNIAENQWYMYDSSHNWVEINEGGGGGGDSKKGYPAYNSKVEDYLYQSYYPTLDYDNAYQIFKEEGDFPALGACSALRKDNLFGRNLDWYYSNQVDFIVKTPHTDSYRATIGIAGGIEELTKDFVESGESSELYKLVPFRLQDGINESGVVACMNVVPTDYGKNVAIPTEEEEVEICSRMLVRYILDNFDTALEAVNYVKKHCKVYFAKSLHDINYEVHIMVADENATFILEFVDGATEIIDVTSDAPYMTNFHRYGVTLNEDNTVETPATGDAIETNGITEYGAGLERFNIIANNYDIKSVREILEEIKYTNTYTLTEDVWYSEFVGGDLKVNSAVEDFTEIVELARQAYEDRSRDEAITWHTTHAVVYDIDSKNAIIRTQEGTTDYTDSSNPSVIISNQDITVTENGVYSAATGYTGLGTVTVNVPTGEPVLDTLSVTVNGTYTPPFGTDGYNEVSVNVPSVPYVTVSGSGAIEAPSSSINAIVQKIYGKSTVVNQSVESVNITTVTIGDIDYPLTFEGSSVNSIRDELYTDANLMVKKVGKVDLGTLAWTYSNIGSSGLKIFRTTSISDMHYGDKSDTSYIGNLLCPLYTVTNYSTISTTSREDKSMACYHTGSDDLYFYIYNSEYTDATAFKNAMSGVYLYYELAFPQTSSASISLEGPISAGQFVSYDSEVETDSVVLFTVGSELTNLSVTSNGTYTPEADMAGFDKVIVNVPSTEAVLESLSITENGTYTPTAGVDGYDEVVVNVPTPDTLHTFLEGPGTVEYNSSALTNLSYAMFLAYVDAPQSSGFGTKTHNYITKINTPNLNKIYGFACTGQDNLTEITVSDNCNIDAAGRAFSYCSSLSKINGHMVLNFGNRPDHMFAYCSAIRWNSADWSGLRTLPDSFFAYSGIDEFDFAKLEGFHNNKQFQGCTNLKKIYYRHFYAFSSYMFDGCTSLEDFYIQYTGGKISMGSGSFNNVPNTMRVHVPSSLLSEYEADGNWNRFELIGDAEPLMTLSSFRDDTEN